MKHYVFALVCLILSVNLLGTSEKKTVFHPNGHKRFEYEVSGVHLNGLFVSYYENGQVKAKGYLKNNRRSGLWTAFYPDGIMHSQRKYVNDDSFHIIHAWDVNGIEVSRQTGFDRDLSIAANSVESVPSQQAYPDSAARNAPDLYDISGSPSQ